MDVEYIEDLQINVWRAADSAPVLIFVHGFACDHHDWDAQVQALSPRFGVVTFDLPGHGASPAPEIASVESLAKTICTIKARHGGDQVILIGHSLGCRLVLEAFRQCPQAVTGVVLVDGSRMASDDVEASVRDMAERLSAVGAHALTRAAFEGMSVLNKDPLLGPSAIARTMLLDGAFAEKLMLSVTRWDAAEVEAVLRQVDVPILILQSTHIDTSYQWRSLEAGMTNAWTQFVTEQAPTAELKVVPGVGHFIHIEAAAVVNNEIAAFADRLAAR